MRVPKLLSLVIATGCCVSQAGKADGAPTNIGVSPTTVAENGQYIISWESCISPCEVISFALVEVASGTTFTKQVGSVTATSDVTTSLPPSLDTAPPYEIVLIYLENSAVLSSSSIIGPTIIVTTTTSNSATSSSATSTTAASQGGTDPIEVSVSLSSKTSSDISSFSPTGRAPVSTPQLSESGIAPPSVPILISTTSTGGVIASGSSESSGASGSTGSTGSTGLSTGAKAGIAIGAIGAALIVLIGAILIWRRRRLQQLRALPDGMPYSHDTGSTNRDLTAEKEMNVINSPVDTLHNGYSAVPSAPHTQSQSQTGSWAPQEEHSTTGAAAAAVPYTDAHRRSHGSGYTDSSPPGTDAQSTMLPIAASGTTIQRKPVGAMSGTTQHLREPGMSDEEVARLEEEERRLDEAIAEAERKRQLQG